MKKPRVKVYQIRPNFYRITIHDTTYYQGYDTIVAALEPCGWTFDPKHDDSLTASRHLTREIGYTAKERWLMIESGTAKLENLN